MTEPPRFNGLARGRGHLRLVAAIGLLASASIATGGLASVISRESTSEPETEPALGLVSRTAKADPTIEVELRVREAEAAAARARAALRDAALDGDDRAAFEQRLDQLGTSPLESARRGYAPPSNELDEAQRQPHLRAITSTSREL
jgi:hypothetical protein